MNLFMLPYNSSNNNSVAGGIMVLSCSSMHASIRPYVHPETLLSQCLAEYLTHFQLTSINDTLWDSDECVTVWGHKVKGQGHSGIKYAGNRTFWAC